jgi:predicted transcriptional regulator
MQTKQNKAIGPWLKEQRNKRRMTQAEVAKIFNCSSSMISHYETKRVLWPSNFVWNKIVNNLLEIPVKN